MAHHNTLRQEKTCENCGHHVEEIFCPHCGQKNVETRQSFGHLVGHFIEDFTHYDTAFWKTIKYLLIRPARLTKEYLAGKRASYVLPVKLYIFISFVAFFMLAIAHSTNRPATSEHHDLAREERHIEFNDVKIYSEQQLDSVTAALGYKQNGIIHFFLKKALNISKNNISGEKLGETFSHTLPKVLFLYMPFFAFWLWLLHGKKRWFFFDHGIFTLHYFSLLLLLTGISATVEILLSLFLRYETVGSITDILKIFIFLYACYYFFAAHRRMYGERRAISVLKCLLLLLINSISILFAMIIALAYVLYSAY